MTVEDGGLDEDLDTTDDNATFTETFTVTVDPVNDVPTLAGIDDLTIDEDDPEQTVDLTGITAGGGESQPLAVTASSDNTDLIEDPSVTYTSDEETGRIAFTPLADQHGTAVITVTVEDGGLDEDLDTTDDNAVFSRTFEVIVNPVNDVPVSVDDTFAVHENTTLTSDSPGVIDNDSDLDGDAIIAVLVDSVSHGTLSLAADGGFNYTPDENFNRTDSFTYRAQDANETGETATVTITVTTDFPWHNSLLAMDVNDDGSIAPNDAIMGVSSLNRDGSRTLPVDREKGVTSPFYDTDRDGSHAPIDVLLVVSFLNSRTNGEGEVSPLGSDLYWSQSTPAFPMRLLPRLQSTTADLFTDDALWNEVRPTSSVRRNLYEAAQLNSPLASWGEFVEALDALLAEEGELPADGLAR